MSHELPLTDLVVRHIGILATLRGPLPRIGPSMRDLGLRRDAALACFRGRIVAIGSDADVDGSVRRTKGAVEIDAERAAIIPGFVDAHTHLAFAGSREDEIQRRLAGATYAEIAAEGGGIVKTVLATRTASEEDLATLVRRRLDVLLSLGTTSAEVKSGYGLGHDAELTSLRAIRRAANNHPVRVVSTFLGAHEVPLDRRSDRDAYISELVEKTIPAVANQRLAEFNDVFCERGVFSVDESRRILQAGQRAGLRARIHADELSHTGGAELAGEIHAHSADHLIRVSSAGIEAMAKAGVVATLMPGASFFLKLGKFAPARELISASVPLALGSDTNPGGGLSSSMPFALALACFSMGLSLEEALSAATIGSAYSVGLVSEVGSIELGKRADFLILATDRLLDLVRVGSDPIRTVVANGQIVSRGLAAA